MSHDRADRLGPGVATTALNDSLFRPLPTDPAISRARRGPRLRHTFQQLAGGAPGLSPQALQTALDALGLRVHGPQLEALVGLFDADQVGYEDGWPRGLRAVWFIWAFPVTLAVTNALGAFQDDMYWSQTQHSQR